MTLSRENHVLHCLRRIALSPERDHVTDGELLEKYVIDLNATAIEELARRHREMVWNVCRRILSCPQDAEDAFQATFLVLLRRAAQIRPREMVANWLYGVARQTALKARSTAHRRALRERPMRELPETGIKGTCEGTETRAIIDLELARLPDRYRSAILLCDLENRSRKETARELGVPEGTLSGWLTRGRLLLADRLARHGLTISGVTLAATLSQSLASTHVPGLLWHSCVRMTDSLSAGVMAAQTNCRAETLANGVAQAMIASKLKTVAAAAVILLSLAIGVDQLTYTAGAQDKSGKSTPSPDKVRQAAVELEAAKAALRQAEANLIQARARITQKEAELRQAQQQVDKSDREPTSNSKAIASLASQFKHRVPFEIGLTETTNNGSIEILEVWGTQPTITVGGLYLIRGKYRLSGQERGKLYFYLTAKDWDNSGPTLDMQTVEVANGEGEFTLMHAMQGSGYFHLWFAGSNDGTGGTIANVYFGTGDNVLRK